MEMKPLEITKLRHFCETRQGFFLITLLESSGFFEPYFRFLVFQDKIGKKKLLKSGKLLSATLLESAEGAVVWKPSKWV